MIPQPHEQVLISGLDPEALTRLRATGVDHAGNEMQTFHDDGAWPLRCCLRDSTVGELLAIVAFSPFPWDSPYRETGPVVIHAEACAGWDGSLPPAFEDRRQVLRAFGADGRRDRTQVYDRHRLVEPGEGLLRSIREVLADPRVEFVQARNVLSQCYSFTAARVGATRD